MEHFVNTNKATGHAFLQVLLISIRKLKRKLSAQATRSARGSTGALAKKWYKSSITFVRVTAVVGKVIPSPWGQQRMHGTQVKAASGQRPCRARGRGKERDSRVSGSETTAPAGSVPRPGSQGGRTRHRARGGVRRRGRRGRRGQRREHGRVAQRQEARTASPTEPPPAGCVLLLEEPSNPKQMTLHPPRVRKTVRANTPQVPPPHA